MDREGNVYVTDAVSDGAIPDGDGRGHIVVKFSPTGDVLMTLGTPGFQGSGNNQFTSPADVVVADNGDIFVADSESDYQQNPGWEMGIRIGDANLGWVYEFVLYAPGYPFEIRGNGAEFVAVDAEGKMYGGEPIPRNLQKYVPVRR